MITKTSKFSVLVPVSNDQEVAIFDHIFSNISYESASLASLSERTQLPHLTYGEIINLDSIRRMFDLIRSKYNGLKGVYSEKFYDLGSGSGKPVIAAAILHPFHSCIGIEILEGLHHLSIQAQLQWSLTTQSTVVEFIRGSFLDPLQNVWVDGDVVFANSTCYGASMMAEVAEIASTMRVGSFFISLSYALPDSSGFRLLDEERLPMSWWGLQLMLYTVDEAYEISVGAWLTSICTEKNTEIGNV
jgi:SAM-dependent methyltransferase